MSNTGSSNGTPRRKWADRSFKVNFDPNNPHLLRPLEERELACIYIYLYHKDIYGSIPSSENKYSAVRKAAKELGINLDLSREVLDQYLFTDLFPHNPDIPFTTAMRRLTGDSSTDSTPEECKVALIWASEQLTAQARKRGENVVQVLPKTSDIKRFVAQRTVVPELACPMPNWETIRRNLGPGAWRDVIQKVFQPPQEVLDAKFPVLASLQDLADDYKKAYKYFYGDFDPEFPQILSSADLEVFKDQGGLGYGKYKSFFVYQNRYNNGANNRFTLDTVRRAASLPEDEIRKTYDIREKRTKWNSSEVFAGFMAAWKYYGIEMPPPTNKQIVDIVNKQTHILDEHGNIDLAKAREQSLPTVLVPCIGTIAKFYGGITELIGYAESIHGVIEFDSQARVNRMATEAIKRNVDVRKLPKAVAQAVEFSVSSKKPARSLS